MLIPLAAILLRPDRADAPTAQPAGALTVAITAVAERSGQPGGRALEVTGVLTGAPADAPEAYVYVRARPDDGSAAGALPRLWYVSKGATVGPDGTWRTTLAIAEGETRPLTASALVGYLCPSSPQAPCTIDDAAIVSGLETGTDTRTWAARSPDFGYQPA